VYSPFRRVALAWGRPENIGLGAMTETTTGAVGKRDQMAASVEKDKASSAYGIDRAAPFV